ncbi:hypothetical protein TELCIR_22243 [Teladorsagia circumcincta]|uniref:Uncharacterized protein n=1 Tax=Teladorsagia circumcincta TaxID=45464 RepID=A0A2G9TEQ0_TELCI|nr:hypothetical protein TELCIR_22243 [Teladorsagia circumcincta]
MAKEKNHDNREISATRMASVPPGDINTQPNSKIVFNAQYDDNTPTTSRSSTPLVDVSDRSEERTNQLVGPKLVR